MISPSSNSSLFNLVFNTIGSNRAVKNPTPEKQTKAIDTLGLCKKNVWDNYVKKSLLIVFIFDKDKFATSDKLEDALIETQYYTYAQLMATNGIISIDYRRTD